MDNVLLGALAIGLLPVAIATVSKFRAAAKQRRRADMMDRFWDRLS